MTIASMYLSRILEFMIEAWKNIVFIFVSISISTNIFGKIELIDRVVAVVDSGVIQDH